MNFTDNDIKQIEAKGLTIAQVKSQIELFKTGIPIFRTLQQLIMV